MSPAPTLAASHAISETWDVLQTYGITQLAVVDATINTLPLLTPPLTRRSTLLQFIAVQDLFSQGGRDFPMNPIVIALLN